MQIITTTTITFLVSTALGWTLKTIKDYKEKHEKNKENEILQNKALQALLKSQLTNTYFVYNELKKIPDYVYSNFLDLLKVYETLGGNDFIHSIAKKMEKWEITKTDIL